MSAARAASTEAARQRWLIAALQGDAAAIDAVSGVVRGGPLQAALGLQAYAGNAAAVAARA
jgi:hypothetical protein